MSSRLPRLRIALLAAGLVGAGPPAWSLPSAEATSILDCTDLLSKSSSGVGSAVLEDTLGGVNLSTGFSVVVQGSPTAPDPGFQPTAGVAQTLGGVPAAIPPSGCRAETGASWTTVWAREGGPDTLSLNVPVQIDGVIAFDDVPPFVFGEVPFQMEVSADGEILFNGSITLSLDPLSPGEPSVSATGFSLGATDFVDMSEPGRRILGVAINAAGSFDVPLGTGILDVATSANVVAHAVTVGVNASDPFEVVFDFGNTFRYDLVAQAPGITFEALPTPEPTSALLSALAVGAALLVVGASRRP